LPASSVDLALSIIRDRYPDFGPTLACEKLRERHGISLAKETVRKLMTEAGLSIPRKQCPPSIYQPRNRRSYVGELIQIDGSDHCWFEDRAPTCTLLVYINECAASVSRTCLLDITDQMHSHDCVATFIRFSIAHCLQQIGELRAAAPVAVPADAGASNALLDATDCLACHAMDREIVGLAYDDVAVRYQGDAQAAGTLEASLRNGSVDKRCDVSMPPFPGLEPEEIRTLLELVLKQ